MLLDTNIVIHACQPGGEWLAPWTTHPDAAIASVTRIEALGFAGISPEEETAILDFIYTSPIYALDDEVIEQAIQLRPKYVRIGDLLTKPVIAPLPPSLQDRCIATPALIAEVLDNRFVCHLPYYRQTEIFARLGVRLHRKTLCDWSLLASDWLAIIYREIQYEHWRCTYRQLDETPIDYLQPGHGKTKTGYLWVSNICPRFTHAMPVRPAAVPWCR